MQRNIVCEILSGHSQVIVGETKYKIHYRLPELHSLLRVLDHSSTKTVYTNLGLRKAISIPQDSQSPLLSYYFS